MCFRQIFVPEYGVKANSATQMRYGWDHFRSVNYHYTSNKIGISLLLQVIIYIG